MFVKQDFVEGESVVIYGLGDDREYSGVIRGRQDCAGCDFYIVEIVGDSFRADYPYSCVMLTEACLRRRGMT